MRRLCFGELLGESLIGGGGLGGGGARLLEVVTRLGELRAELLTQLELRRRCRRRRLLRRLASGSDCTRVVEQFQLHPARLELRDGMRAPRLGLLGRSGGYLSRLLRECRLRFGRRLARRRILDRVARAAHLRLQLRLHGAQLADHALEVDAIHCGEVGWRRMGWRRMLELRTSRLLAHHRRRSRRRSRRCLRRLGLHAKRCLRRLGLHAERCLRRLGLHALRRALGGVLSIGSRLRHVLHHQVHRRDESDRARSPTQTRGEPPLCAAIWGGRPN